VSWDQGRSLWQRAVVSDIVPGIRTPSELSRDFLGQRFQGSRFTHYVEIDATGLGATQGRAGVYVIPNDVPLDLDLPPLSGPKTKIVWTTIEALGFGGPGPALVSGLPGPDRGRAKS
jgi:hypothetical protein